MAGDLSRVYPSIHKKEAGTSSSALCDPVRTKKSRKKMNENKIYLKNKFSEIILIIWH